MNRWWTLLIILLVLVCSIGQTPTRINAWPNHARFTASPPKRSSSAIAITADGSTLLVVNPDSNSLSLVNLGTLATVIEMDVGVDPRTVAVNDAGDRAYVANRGSDSVSVVDLAARQVITEVTVGDRPYGVVVSADGTRLYVAEQGIDRLTILDTTTLTSPYRPGPQFRRSNALSDAPVEQHDFYHSHSFPPDLPSPSSQRRHTRSNRHCPKSTIRRSPLATHHPPLAHQQSRPIHCPLARRHDRLHPPHALQRRQPRPDFRHDRVSIGLVG
jgi:YVTN family beta-propeller protein